MNTSNIWPQVHKYCDQLTSLLKDKTGHSLPIPSLCLEAETLINNYFALILTALGLLITYIILMFFLKKVNKRINVFQATLLSVKVITHDTKIFTFDLPKGWNKIGLQIGEHLQLSANINGQLVERKYTPISRADLKRNSFDLLIKIYEKGKMSSHVNQLKIGQTITVSLPYGRFNYLGNQMVSITDLNNKETCIQYDHLYLIGGGTGITPLYQIIQYVSEVESPEERGPNLTLLFANRSENDILLKGELQNFELSNPKFKCYLSVDKAETETWTGFKGFIDEDKIKQTIPKDISNTLFAACGPPIMVNLVEKMLITKFNIKPERFFRF